MVTKVTKEDIIEAISSSLSMAEAGSKLPMNQKTFTKYAKIYGVYIPNQSGKGISKFKASIDLNEILSGLHPQYSTHRLKLRLIKEKDWLHKCSRCGGTTWLGHKTPLELDHIDGNPNNHLENNIRFLCPNCHALTPTYRGKNQK